MGSGGKSGGVSGGGPGGVNGIGGFSGVGGSISRSAVPVGGGGCSSAGASG